MISRQRTAGSVSIPGIPGGWYPSVRGSPRSAARGQPRRRRPLPRPGGPRRRGGGAAPPRRAAHSPHPDTTGPHSSTPVRQRIHPRPSPPRPARACGPAAHDGSARARCPAGTRHHRANCSCATVSSSTSPPAHTWSIRRPPLSGQIRGVQPVRRRHPMHKRPRRLTHHGHHPQDCLHRTASPLATRPGGAPQHTRGTGPPIPVHGERASRCPVPAAAVDERADPPRLPPRRPRHTPATPADGDLRPG